MTIDDIKANDLLLFECISGSKAYGLATTNSDTDLKGVFYLPKDRFYGLDYLPQVNNETNDEVYYELGRFVELLVKNNPNMLELLASPEDCVLHRHPLMSKLPIDLFLSKLCKESFAGYAITQIRKARGYKKKIVNPVDPERKSVLDFCYVLQGSSSMPLKEWLDAHGIKQEDCGLSSVPHAKGLYALFHGAYSGIISSETANDVSLSSIPKGEQPKGYLAFNKEAYSAHCKEYLEYWEWVKTRNEQRYQGNMQHGKGYDAKNMMHTIRLLQVAKEILVTRKLTVQRQNREELLAIKSGHYEYEDLVRMADGLIAEVDQAYLKSNLPETPDRNRAEAALIEMRELLYS